MSLPEATLNCPICDSPEHTLTPVLEGEYRGKYVCNTCYWKLRENRNNPSYKIQKYRWNKKLQDYIPINY